MRISDWSSDVCSSDLLKPFGRRRAGLKLLAIDAPPKRMALTVPALLDGSEAASLDRAGYRRADLHALDPSLEGGLILDGELYGGGDIVARAGAPHAFAVQRRRQAPPSDRKGTRLNSRH